VQDDALADVERLAVEALPTLADLPGPGWAVDAGAGDGGDDEDGAGGPSPGGVLAGLADACLPGDFPDRARRADAEAAFRRDEVALVLALASVFDDRGAAAAAWHALGGERFVRCFAESIAGEVRAGTAVELLGPLVTPGDLTVERGARRTERWRVAFSGASAAGLSPVVLHVAVVLAGCVVVVLWVVDDGGAGSLDRWEHLVDRAERRLDALVRAHPDVLDR
jgi:hypothetical protein